MVVLKVHHRRITHHQDFHCFTITLSSPCCSYTNATWTLKCDLTCEYVCHLLQHMDRHHYTRCVPHLSAEDNATQPTQPLLNLNSSYITRSVATFPKQGLKAPWKYYQNFLMDIRSLRYGGVEDGIMKFL